MQVRSLMTNEETIKGVDLIAKFKGYTRFKCPNGSEYYLRADQENTVEETFTAIAGKECIKLTYMFELVTSYDELTRVAQMIYQQYKIELFEASSIYTDENISKVFAVFQVINNGEKYEKISTSDNKTLALFISIVEVLNKQIGSKTC